MNNHIKLKIRSDIEVSETDNSEIVFSNKIIVQRFINLKSGMKTAFKLLKNEGETESKLLDLVLSENGFEGLMNFTMILKKLESIGFIQYQISMNDEADLVLIPLSGHFQFVNFKPKNQYKLSKFSLLRFENQNYIFESPLGFAKIQFTNPILATLFLALYQPFQIDDLQTKYPEYSAEILREFIGFVFQLNCLQEVDENGETIENDFEKPLAYWEFHDLYYHSRSRMGRHNNAYGGVFPFGEKAQIPPSFKNLNSEIRISLAKPDLENLRKTDISLTTAIEDRQSVRNHSENPLNFEQLSEFLFRTSRINRTLELNGHHYIQKPYPSGGGLYELEVYPLVNQCEGIDKGLYYYDPQNHELCLLKTDESNLDLMLTLAQQTVASDTLPHVVLIITTRFQRLSHKYRSVTYSLILKHVGVLYQTMYLVAKSMNLAPCAMGGGESDLFAKTTGIDYLEESQVGEFLLGSI